MTATAVRAGLRGPELGRGLVELLGPDAVLLQNEDLLLYEYDGAVDTATPDAVVLPTETADVAKVARFCAQHGVPLVPRGAGTGLSGGAILWLDRGVGLPAAKSQLCQLSCADAASARSSLIC